MRNVELIEQIADLKSEVAEDDTDSVLAKLRYAEIALSDPCAIPCEQCSPYHSEATEGVRYLIDQITSGHISVKHVGRPSVDEQPEQATDREAGLVAALERLARLGNGEHYGNSDGNVIAQEALAKYRGER